MPTAIIFTCEVPVSQDDCTEEKSNYSLQDS